MTLARQFSFAIATILTLVAAIFVSLANKNQTKFKAMTATLTALLWLAVIGIVLVNTELVKKTVWVCVLIMLAGVVLIAFGSAFRLQFNRLSADERLEQQTLYHAINLTIAAGCFIVLYSGLILVDREINTFPKMYAKYKLKNVGKLEEHEELPQGEITISERGWMYVKSKSTK